MPPFKTELLKEPKKEIINQFTYLVGDKDEVKIQIVYHVSNVDLREKTFDLDQEWSKEYSYYGH